MRLPKFVDVIGTRFVVEEYAFDHSGEEKIFGTSNQMIRLIRVHPTLTDEQKVEVFYHEIAHIILAHMGVSSLLSREQDEAIAQAFGVALSYILTHNKLPKVPR